MRVLLNRTVTRFVRKAALPDETLCEAARHLLAGQFDADLGGGVYKQRVARPGSGKRGGFRLLVAIRRHAVVFFLYGFSKSDRENVTLAELQQLRKLAAGMLELTDQQIAAELHLGLLREVQCHGEAV